MNSKTKKMLRSLPLSIVLLSLFVPFVSASAMEVEDEIFPYVTTYLGQQVSISMADYAALSLTAYYNNTAAMTDKLIRQSVRCVLGDSTVDIFVDTITQDEWDTYVLGEGFSAPDEEVVQAYWDAAQVVNGWVQKYFYDIDMDYVRIVFTVKGYLVGIYQFGEFSIIR